MNGIRYIFAIRESKRLCCVATRPAFIAKLKATRTSAGLYKTFLFACIFGFFSREGGVFQPCIQYFCFIIFFFSSHAKAAALTALYATSSCMVRYDRIVCSTTVLIVGVCACFVVVHYVVLNGNSSRNILTHLHTVYFILAHNRLIVPANRLRSFFPNEMK